MRLHELGSLMTVVELVWGSIRIPALGEDENVGSATKWVGEDGDWAQVDVRVVSGSLTSRRAVEVPFWEILELDAALCHRGNGLRSEMSAALVLLGLH